jgi:hypothetical protein
MAVTRTESNVFYGIADIWWHADGTAAPTSAATLQAPDAAGYTSVGFTAEGVELEVSKDLTDITVEEQLNPVDTVLSGLGIVVRFAIAEDTLAVRQLAYGIGTIVTTAFGASQIGKKVLTLGETLAKKALVVDVVNPLGYTTRIHIPSVASVASVGTSYKRAEKRIYPIEYKALCAASAITILEQTDIAH